MNEDENLMHLRTALSVTLIKAEIRDTLTCKQLEHYVLGEIARGNPLCKAFQVLLQRVFNDYVVEALARADGGDTVPNLISRMSEVHKEEN